MESEIHELPDGFVLDVTARRLLAGEEDVEIHEHAFLLLTHFARHPNEVIKNEDLKRAVWGDKPVKVDSLVACVREIRRALDNERSIENQHGRGYIFRNPKAIESRKKSAPSDPEVISQTQPAAPVGIDEPAEIKPTNAGSPISQPPDEDGTDAKSEDASAEGANLNSSRMNSGELSDRRESNAATRVTEHDLPFLVAISVGVVVLVIVGFQISLEWTPIRRFAYVEAVLISGGIAYNLLKVYFFRKSKLLKSQAELAVQQFQILWTVLLGTWLALYIVWAFNAESHHVLVLATFLNNLNSLMLVLCYLVLNEPTVPDDRAEGVEKAPLFGLKGFIGLIVVLASGIVEEIVVVIFDFRGSENKEYALFLSDLFSGVAGGVAMSLFISRLHSRLLGESTVVPLFAIILYSYAVIQPFYAVVNQPLKAGAPALPAPWSMVVGLGSLIVVIALILKLVMFVYVTALIRNEHLLVYMKNAKRIYAEVERQWRKE